MGFWEDVRLLREQKKIPKQWSRPDIRPFLDKFAENTINSLPSNQSMTRDGRQRGNYVLRGSEPKAWRMGDGKFELIEDPADPIEVQRAHREEARRICQSGISKYQKGYPNNKPRAGRERPKKFTSSERQREEQISQQIKDLCKEFTTDVELGKQKYTGPSVYFHLKTVDKFKELGNSVLTAAKDERFCELLYATLVAWGMHRMGKRGAQMPDFDHFADSIAGLAPEIDELSDYRITTLFSEDMPGVVDKLWSIIHRLEGSKAHTKLVANSKILHHLLPYLVPPIDRKNTGDFFGFKSQDWKREENIFRFVFPKMVSIAKSVKTTLDALIYEGFNSSPTKVIDNAIIGYVLKYNLKNKQKAGA